MRKLYTIACKDKKEKFNVFMFTGSGFVIESTIDATKGKTFNIINVDESFNTMIRFLINYYKTDYQSLLISN